MAEIHVLMATYNGEKYLKEQLDSILGQTFRDWCLYISDDGSTDGTLNIIYDYERRYPDRIKLLSQGIRHGGAKENFSYLMESCPKAKYYMFADQDDVWFPQKMEKMLPFVRRKETSRYPLLVYCMLQIVNDRLEALGNPSDFALITPPDRSAAVLQYNYIPGCTMLFNHELRELAGSIPKEAVMHDWWLVLCAHYMGSIVCCNCCLQNYRRHDNNVTAIGRKKGVCRMLLTVCREKSGKIKKVLDFETEKLLRYRTQNKVFYARYEEQLTPKSTRNFHIWFSLFREKGIVRRTVMYWRYVRSETRMVTIYDWITFLIRFPISR